jgi:Zn-finger nucleic acid-binding protein
VGTAGVHECAGCGGLWLDAETFQRVCEEREEQAAVMAAPPGAREAVAPETVRYVPCPACGDLMARVNFQRISGVVLDQCRRHGTWFDRDELRRVVEFIRAGGMDRARQRELERLAEERRRLESARAEAARGSYADREWSDPREEAGPLSVDIVQVLARLFRGT